MGVQSTIHRSNPIWIVCLESPYRGVRPCNFPDRTSVQRWLVDCHGAVRPFRDTSVIYPLLP